MVPLLVCLLLQAAPAQTIVLGGDIMLNGISVNQKPLEGIRGITRPAGATIFNLEIPLTTAVQTTTRKSSAELRARTQFILKADPMHGAGLASIGVDLVSLGNNHCMDYREAGLDQMRKVLTKNGIGFAGAGSSWKESRSVAVYVAADGRRIGLLSALAFMSVGGLRHCTPARTSAAGIATLSFGGVIDKKAKAQLADWIGKAKLECDLLVVGLHWGVERQSVPNAYQVALGRACVDSGADVVWGNHPHVLQGAELYNGKPILYSMGNLISSKGGSTGLVKLVYEEGQFSRAQFFPLVISGGRVKPVEGRPGQAAVKAYKGLCELLLKRYPSKVSKSLL
jgi:poly-gamma-glutamate capsule biosynthesis protein CapA/YwtB (metallophosphatase superfamily)